MGKTNLIHLAIAVGILIIAWILTRVNHAFFKKVRKRREGLHVRFLERIISALVLVAGIILAVSAFGGLHSVWQTILGGTAVITAVLAFAAQDVIKDVLAGLMISMYKPFEIGNRIELEDGLTGIVVDITMRHVVLQAIDTEMIVIPNSKLNLMRLKNYSYHADTRSARFNFYIAYGSDVKQAIHVIREAIISSPHSVPGKKTKHGMEYADVYFMAFEDSSLRLVTTVYYEANVASEVLISDINSRVNEALKDNGIEIPYQYVNVIEKVEETKK